MASFFDRFLAKFEELYPESYREFQPRENFWAPLVCPDTIQLPAELIDEAKSIVNSFWLLRENPERAAQLSGLPPEMIDPGNYSALMSYDFHLDEEGRLRLIEINTNASQSLFVDLLHEVHGLKNPFSTGFREEMAETFRNECQLAGQATSKPISAAIIDDNPSQQRLYAEFLLWRELLNRSGFETSIADGHGLVMREGRLVLASSGKPIDLVYNRDTDFYFESHPDLHKAMIERATCFSPHPHEYRLLADKERLLELSKPGAIEALPIPADAKEIIGRTLIHTWDINDFADPASLWAKRRKLFFKPKRSFGGKAAYRGSSITKPTFAEVIEHGSYVVQEYVPAPPIVLKSLPEDKEFRYDLRFYVYKNKIQLACGRVYKGQMTNSRTLGGGSAVIDWV